MDPDPSRAEHARISAQNIPQADRTERARIAANIRWAKEPNRQAATAPGLRAIREKWEREVDPDGLLSPALRRKMAENARKAHLARIRLKASKAARLPKDTKTA